jgi:cytoskeleton protein RodZ
VLGAQGQPLFSRVLQPGEAVGVDGPAPLRLRIGNVQGTSLTFRGQAVDLAPYTRDNVARLELR